MALLTIVATVLAGFTAWRLWTFTKTRILYDMHKIPGPGAWPVLGNLGEVIGTSSFHKVQAAWSKQYGTVLKWYLGPTAVLLVTEPEEVLVLSGQQLKLPKWPAIYGILNTRPPPHYSMLGTPDYEEWKYMRKMTSPAFSPSNLRKVFPTVLETAHRAAETVQQVCKTGLVDVDAIALSLTAEVIMKAMFEHDMDLLKTEVLPDGSVKLVKHEYLQHQKDYQDHLNLMLTNPMWGLWMRLCPWHPQAKKAGIAGKGLAQKEDELADMINGRGKQPEDNTMLWACLGRAVNYQDESPLHHDTLAANAGLFFGAGYESSGHAVAWALFELAANQRLQAAVRQDVRDAISPGNNRTELDLTELTKLQLLNGVVKETLRVHGTLPLGTARVTDRDLVIKGYRIPKGTPIMMPSHPMHASDTNYLRPNDFWPERWGQAVHTGSAVHTKSSDKTAQDLSHHMDVAWNPFSTGPHNCIGQGLAMQELHTVLAVFLSKFKFELPDGVTRDKFLNEEQVLWISLRPREGLPLKVIPISA